jgi:hypothetical protein
MAIYLSLGLLQGVQAKEEAFSPQKRTSSTSKNEIHELFSTFVGQQHNTTLHGAKCH